MAAASEKRSRWHTALDLDDLRARLSDVDESNRYDLLDFKQALQAVVNDIASISPPPVPIVSIPASQPLTIPHTTAQDAIPTIAAAKLTRTEVFTFFGLQNELVTKWGRSGYDIRPFELRPEFRASDTTQGPSEWLTQALDLCGAVFGRNNEADMRTYINLLIMDVIQDVQHFQGDDQLYFAARAKNKKTPHVTPGRCASVVRAHNEVQIATTLQVEGKELRILGRIDFGFSHGTASAKQLGGMFTDSYLAVLETKGVRCDTESAFNQLLAYLAIVRRARSQKFKSTGVVNGNCMVYGVLSDGDKFLFVCLDNNAIVWRSRELDVINNLPEILQHLRHSLAVVTTSSSTSSRRKIRIGDARVAVPDVDLKEQYEEELDFEAIKKRMFRFKTGEYDERDILRWPKET